MRRVNLIATSQQVFVLRGIPRELAWFVSCPVRRASSFSGLFETGNIEDSI
jgi:hypothetical protein